MKDRNLSKTIEDAQAFIDSVNKFNTPPSERERGSDERISSDLGDLGSDLVSSSDSPVQNNIENPKDKKDKTRFSFPSITFSRPQEYTNPFRVDVLTYVEVYYYENKKLPDIHILHEAFRSHPDRPNFLKGWNSVLDSISDSLQNRGIKPYNTTENYIDPKFAWAVSLIVNYLDKRTIPAKLKEAGLTTKEWQAFLRRKRHFEYYQTRLDEVFDQDVRNAAKISLSRSIENGDLQAIKYYNELKNIYRPETQSAIQMVSIVLTAVMEILAREVSSEILNKVAAEIRTTPAVRKIIEIEAK